MRELKCIRKVALISHDKFRLFLISGGDEMSGISIGALVAIVATFFTIAVVLYIIFRKKRK